MEGSYQYFMWIVLMHVAIFPIDIFDTIRINFFGGNDRREECELPCVNDNA